jgi:hypothetical protein
MAPLLSAGPLLAHPETVTVQVTFVNPAGIGVVNDLQFGTLDQNLADPGSVAVAPDIGEGGTKRGGVEDRPHSAASLTVTAAPGQAITIHAEAVDSAAGYSLSDFHCNYDAGSDKACGGAGYTETSVDSGSLLVGATLTGDGTAVAGAADGTFEVTITYQ